MQNGNSDEQMPGFTMQLPGELVVLLCWTESEDLVQRVERVKAEHARDVPEARLRQGELGRCGTPRKRQGPLKAASQAVKGNLGKDMDYFRGEDR